MVVVGGEGAVKRVLSMMVGRLIEDGRNPSGAVADGRKPRRVVTCVSRTLNDNDDDDDDEATGLRTSRAGGRFVSRAAAASSSAVALIVCGCSAAALQAGDESAISGGVAAVGARLGGLLASQRAVLSASPSAPSPLAAACAASA